MGQLRELANRVHGNAVEKGFWDNFNDNEEFLQKCMMDDRVMEFGKAIWSRNNFIATQMGLIHSEVSEALESLRSDRMHNFGEELADIVIRTLDLAEGLGINLEKEIEQKMEKNAARPRMHGKVF